MLEALDSPRDFFAVAPREGAIVGRRFPRDAEMAAERQAPAMGGRRPIDIVTLRLTRCVSGVLRVRPDDAGSGCRTFSSPGGWVVAGLGDRVVLRTGAHRARSF
jgi:hypothetical protein